MGSPYLNTEIKKLAVELDKSILKRKLKTKIFIPESSNLKNLYGFDSFIKVDKNPKEYAAYNQIYAFFDPSSKNYIGNLKTVAHKIAGHSYHTHLRNKELVDVRKKVADATAKISITRNYLHFRECKFSISALIKAKKSLTSFKGK